MQPADTNTGSSSISLPSPWADVPPEQWKNWRWQLSNRLNSVTDFQKIVRLTAEEHEGLSAPGLFRTDVTPYFASLMDPDDPDCPIRRQVIPTAQEIEPFEAEQTDPLAEEAQSPVPGLVHRYPDRVLMLLTTQCASYCRFCTRSRIVGVPTANFSRVDMENQIAYIAAHPQIRDVLISGGDALLQPDRILQEILSRIRALPHVEIIRMSTRVPIFLPQRITQDLVDLLKQFHPFWLNVHVNHPKEITPEVSQALALLADGGIPLGSQSVLLAGINDCPNILRALVHKLVSNRVRPYYLYQCDLVRGSGHFRTPVARGIELMEALHGHTSGYAIPTYVVDAPLGGGKIPLLPNYLLSMSESRVVLRNYEGYITTYTQPRDYHSHNPENCPYCQASPSGPVQAGVAALLSGQASAIVPEGWHKTHKR
ncbi:MAG TPA: lysine 2,3-aminomutase [Ktedonobacteraceae bacterium]|nr:lysine 2,3-aminomutase [Ktedonobacteraceae bacterium]